MPGALALPLSAIVAATSASYPAAISTSLSVISMLFPSPTESKCWAPEINFRFFIIRVGKHAVVPIFVAETRSVDGLLEVERGLLRIPVSRNGLVGSILLREARIFRGDRLPDDLRYWETGVAAAVAIVTACGKQEAMAPIDIPSPSRLFGLSVASRQPYCFDRLMEGPWKPHHDPKDVRGNLSSRRPVLPAHSSSILHRCLS